MGVKIVASSPIKTPLRLPVEKASLGLGFLYVDLTQPLDIPFYLNAEDFAPADLLRIRPCPDRTVVFHTTSMNDELRPYSMYRGNTPEEAEAQIRSGLVGIPPELIFRVLRHEGQIWTVAIDEYGSEEQYRTMILRIPAEQLTTRFQQGSINPRPAGCFFGFESWEQRLTSRGVSPLDHPITAYDRPDGKVILHANFACFRGEKIEGEWLEIHGGWGWEGIPENFSGWVRWRESESLRYDTRVFLE